MFKEFLTTDGRAKLANRNGESTFTCVWPSTVFIPLLIVSLEYLHNYRYTFQTKIRIHTYLSHLR